MRYLLALFAVLALASGCTGAGDGSVSSSETGSAGRAAIAPNEAQAKPPSAAQATAPILGDRRLARSAQLAMAAPDVGTVVTQARQIAVTAGGYSGSERTDTSFASLSLSVPSDRLDDVLTRLSALAHVTSSQQAA